ncbi:hypothetical protein FRAHR75_30127 [Frankia sp. Hr75.2]|nr:hypothetical protein FRAHR75_30127 [Frankia sp. Hr75.2]
MASAAGSGAAGAPAAPRRRTDGGGPVRGAPAGGRETGDRPTGTGHAGTRLFGGRSGPDGPGRTWIRLHGTAETRMPYPIFGIVEITTDGGDLHTGAPHQAAHRRAHRVSVPISAR